MILTKMLKESALFGTLLRNNSQFSVFFSIVTWMKEVLTYVRWVLYYLSLECSSILLLTCLPTSSLKGMWGTAWMIFLDRV